MDWIKIFGSADDAMRVLVANKPQLVIIDGKRISLVRQDSRFYAFQDRCPHSGESLSKGTVNYLGEVVCPFHGYCFSIATGRESAERTPDLEIYPLRADDTGFYIGV